MSTVSPRALWRLGSIVLFSGVPLLLLALTVSNLIAVSEAHDLAARQEATLNQITAEVVKRRGRMIKEVDAASLYLASASGSLARAEIQDRAAKLVEQAGGRLAEVQLTATPEQEAEGAVAIQLTLDIDNKGLLDLLYAVETGVPLLDVTALSVQKTSGPSEEALNNLLRVEMTVRGHWRKGRG